MATAKKDAITLLKEDHRKVEGLFEQFEKARKADRKSALAKEICTELTVHAMIEEEIFYPACQEAVKEDTLNEAYVEHDGAKVLIGEIEAGTPEDEFYDAKVKVLSEQIKHHVREEEMRAEGLFAQARSAGLDVVALGERLERRKTQLMAEIKANGLPMPETRSFTGAKLKRGTPVSEKQAAE
ncbi:hemerythrin domain-containing protein [Dongia rigui]|uniref:Hemerythrin domain-containing protein n=1 Tax=Dongia rigui TaxID=940149 RepID=A0ABU5E079_9PROT|nr:hemerythrin domain-containing protein [Dongia rigui]MDY0872978.1 hemerythrin domain-containing protein [Dongia rigui]